MPIAALVFLIGPVALLVLPIGIVIVAQVVARVWRRGDRWDCR
jgi:hypothetical protein